VASIWLGERLRKKERICTKREISCRYPPHSSPYRTGDVVKLIKNEQALLEILSGRRSQINSCPRLAPLMDALARLFPLGTPRRRRGL
jgi:hypothetical protein